MKELENRDTRYFIEMNLSTHKIERYGYDQKQNLDNGHQLDPDCHRIFVTKGQYNKLVSRCFTK